MKDEHWGMLFVFQCLYLLFIFTYFYLWGKIQWQKKYFFPVAGIYQEYLCWVFAAALSPHFSYYNLLLQAAFITTYFPPLNMLQLLLM